MDLKQFIPAILFAAVPVFAQDSTYVRNIEDKLSVQVFALNTSNDFVFDYVDDGLQVNLIPNQKTTINIGVQYDIIAFSFGFAPAIFADNRDNKGSKMMSFATALYPGRFMQKLEFFYQRGMTLEDANNTAAFIYLPKLKSLKIGGSTSYVLNRNFSFRAVTLQNAKQLRSQGSFAPGLSYYYTNLDGRHEPLLNSRAYFIDVAAEMAYHYNWVFGKNFLLASGISLGGGVSWTVDDGSRYTAAMYTAGLMLAPGYNAERWFAGAQIRVHYNGHESESAVTVGDAVGYTTAFVGYRFDAPTFLEQQKDKIKNKIKL